MKGDRLLTVDQVATEFLYVSPKTVRRMASEGQFKCGKIRGSLRIWEASVKAYLERKAELWALENPRPEDF